jgi:hypothetical protein
MGLTTHRAIHPVEFSSVSAQTYPFPDRTGLMRSFGKMMQSDGFIFIRVAPIVKTPDDACLRG